MAPCPVPGETRQVPGEAKRVQGLQMLAVSKDKHLGGRARGKGQGFLFLPFKLVSPARSQRFSDRIRHTGYHSCRQGFPCKRKPWIPTPIACFPAAQGVTVYWLEDPVGPPSSCATSGKGRGSPWGVPHGFGGPEWDGGSALVALTGDLLTSSKPWCNSKVLEVFEGFCCQKCCYALRLIDLK